MSSPPSTTVLITGATRGIGLGLVTRYLDRSNHLVIAAVRDPSGASSKALESLPRASGASLIIVKIDLTSPTDPSDAISQLTSTHGIDHLDVVIANAGIAEAAAQVSQIKVEDFERHITANVYGFVWLYQATLPLLKKATKPLLVYVGSGAGSIGVRPLHLCLRVIACHSMLTFSSSECNLEGLRAGHHCTVRYYIAGTDLFFAT